MAHLGRKGMAVIPCVECGKMHPIAGLVYGMCPECAEKKISELDNELVRLRRIEKAVMSLSLGKSITLGLDGVIAMWQLMERDAPPMYAKVCNAIVSALEKSR